MKKVTNDDIKYLKRTMENMLYLKEQAQHYEYQAESFQSLVDKECKISSQAYDKIPGTTYSNPTPFLNELIIKQATSEKLAREAKEKRELLDLDNNITERFKKISRKHQEIIYAIYIKGEPITKIAEERGIKVQTLREKIDCAIKKMLEVEPYGADNVDKK